MLKRTFFLFIFFSISLITYAQSGMSDNQVIEFLIEQKQSGVPESAIVPKLMQRGVTVEQLKRVRRMYESQKKQMGTVNTSPEQEEDNKRKRANKRAADYNNVDVDNTNATEDQFVDELTYLDIDSVIYKQNLLKEYNQSKIFGHNIFNNENLTFEPNQNMPTPSNYRLGPGDKVYIDIWGASQKSFESTITPEGIVVLENVGPVKLSGLTIREATKKLRGSLGRYYSSSQISITLGEPRTIQVQVMGEVKFPGTYALSALSTAFNALYAAGGVSDLGTLRDIKVMRGGSQISSIDVYDYILNGNLYGNVKLQDNDIIVVGTYKTLVCLRGKVKRPMYYEMRNNESVSTLIDYAGGFAGDAYKKNVRLIRSGGKEFSIYNIDEFDMSSFALQDGDSVYVDSVLHRYSNMVELKGAVMYPGMYQIDGNAFTLKSILEMANGLREDAYKDRVVIYRQQDDLTMETVTANLENILNGTEPDIPLRKNDIVMVQSKVDLIGEQTIEITGEVNYPGKYLFAANTSIHDFILQAGGFTEAASLAKVDVYRRVNNKYAFEASDTIAQLFTFNFEDGLTAKDGEFILEPFDKVVVRKSPDYEIQKMVAVRGCVNFTGTYILKSNNYTLSDLINDAGGITEIGYAKGARLERKLTYEERRQREESYRKEQIAMYEESMTSTEKNYDLAKADSLLKMKLELGRNYSVEINLEKALEDPKSPYNITLREGDILSVPQYTNTVRISGDVMRPSMVNFKKGETLTYYIEHAGGYSENAKKRNTYVIYMNGAVEKVSKHSRKVIQPGCEIVVPSKIATNKMDTKEILSLGSSTASIAAMIVAITRMK